MVPVRTVGAETPPRPGARFYQAASAAAARWSVSALVIWSSALDHPAGAVHRSRCSLAPRGARAVEQTLCLRDSKDIPYQLLSLDLDCFPTERMPRGHASS